MGTFRFVLALAVLLAHIATALGPSVVNRNSLHILVWSGEAVFAFFVISGFYMSLIVNEKYARLRGGTWRFYLNRALRLYPIHWTLLVLYGIGYAWYGAPWFLLGDFREPFARWVYAVVSNVVFLGVEALPIAHASNWHFVVGPIWSLSIECYFYLLAPFIVGRRLRTLALLFAAALALRLGMYIAGVPLLPWRYFFFPADLVFFLMGSLAWRIYRGCAIIATRRGSVRRPRSRSRSRSSHPRCGPHPISTSLWRGSSTSSSPCARPRCLR